MKNNKMLYSIVLSSIIMILMLVSIVGAVPVEIGPTGVAVSPDGTKVYVVNSGNVSEIDSSGKTISVIDTATNTVTATVNVGIGPLGVAVIPDGTKVYVTNSWSNTTSVIDTASNTVTATVPVGWGPTGVAVSPDGTKVYVANNLDNTTSVIDTTNNTVIAMIPVGISPCGVTVSPDGTKVYVANSGVDKISVIDTVSDTVTTTVNVETNYYNKNTKPADSSTHNLFDWCIWQARTTHTIGEYNKAPENQIYVVVTIKINNTGDKTYSTNPNYWHLKIGDVYYTHDSATYDNSLNYMLTDVGPGGKITTHVVFLLDGNPSINDMDLYYNGPGSDGTLNS